MTPNQAWLYAAEWGSAMHAGDPGACMYGFDEKFIMQSEGHRADCLAWIEGCKDYVVASPEDYGATELAKLDELAGCVRRAPVDGTPRVVADDADALDEFLDGMLNCALWSSTDTLPSDDGDPDSEGETVELDRDHTQADIAPATLAALRDDAVKFIALCGSLIKEENFTGRADGTIWSRAGHDFWLTRCGHGAGFWDGDWVKGVEDLLTKASNKFGNVDLYIGDDNMIHG